MGERGFSISELLVSLLLMTVISMLFYQLFIGTMGTNMMLESHNDLATLGQRSVNTIKEEILQSKVLFQDDTRGQGFLSKLAVPSVHPVLNGTLLPIIDDSGTIKPDTSTRRTGNSLLLLRELTPTSYWIDHDADGGTADIEVLVDLYSFEYVYLSPNTSRSFKQQGHYLDLVRAQSEEYASYVQLAGLTPTARTALASQLSNDGVGYAVDPWKDVSQAFYAVESGGALNGPQNHTIALDEYESLLPEFRGGRVAGKMTYSVGIQHDPPFPAADPVNLFAQASGDFPGGLEALIVGSTSARRVLVRLALYADYGNKINSHVNVVTSTTSEF
jgi:hypothetical protein